MLNKIIKTITFILLCMLLVISCEDQHAHAYQFSKIIKEATCIEEGKEEWSCVCGEVIYKLIALKEHTWDAGVVTTVPTVDTEGVKTYTCSVCHETKTETIAKHVHDYKLQYKSLSYIDSCIQHYICSCGEIDLVKGEISTAPLSLENKHWVVYKNDYQETDETCPCYGKTKQIYMEMNFKDNSNVILTFGANDVGNIINIRSAHKAKYSVNKDINNIEIIHITLEDDSTFDLLLDIIKDVDNVEFTFEIHNFKGVLEKKTDINQLFKTEITKHNHIWAATNAITPISETYHGRRLLCTHKGYKLAMTSDNAFHLFSEPIYDPETGNITNYLPSETCSVCGYRKGDEIKSLKLFDFFFGCH